MLNPEEFTKYADEFLPLIAELEAYIIFDIARRIEKAARQGKTPATIKYQVEALEEFGIEITEIKERIKKTANIAIEKIDRVFEDANVVSFNREKEFFELAGKTLVFSAAKSRLIKNSVRDIEREFLSFTGSLGLLGMPLEQAYQHSLNTAYLQVASGAFDYVSAVRNQVKALADSGLEVITNKSGHRTPIISWESGHIDKLDVSIRRAVITGLAQATQKVSIMNAEEMNAPCYQVSAHMGARTGSGVGNHKGWQGKIYSNNGDTSIYPDFYEVTGYGSIQGLGGINCRHSFFAAFPGQKPYYTWEELNDIDPLPFEFMGEKFGAYKATQKQRSIERSIRKTKREIMGYKAAGLVADAKDARGKLKVQRRLYREFSKKAGLLEQPERLGVVI